MNKNRRRSAFYLGLAKTVAWPTIKATSFKTYNVPGETASLIEHQNKHKDCALFLVGPHKSMWETPGIPYTLTKFGGDTPFALMGNNLIKKETGIKEAVLKYVIERAGIIWVEREKNPKMAMTQFVEGTEKMLSKNRNIMLFPEGTRSRDGLVKEFKPAGFQGAINASKNTDVYLVPFNVDYSILLEIDEFVENSNTYTFKVSDFRKWRKTYLDKIYVSFGKPTLISPEDNRKDLAYKSREECLDLIKILPVNVMSTAILRLNPEGQIKTKRVEESIETVIKDLEEQQHKFRGFNINMHPKKIIENAKQKIEIKFLPAYNIYANYISHYLK